MFLILNHVINSSVNLQEQQIKLQYLTFIAQNSNTSY